VHRSDRTVPTAENVVVFVSGLEVMTVAKDPEPMKMNCRDWPRD
jgi:hypothetical protein